MMGNIMMAVLAGVGVSLFLRRLTIGPAVFVTTFTYAPGFMFFLGLVVWFINPMV